MTDEMDFSVEFAGIKLNNPVFTVSGTCGYVNEMEDFIDINQLGGFITKSISVHPRNGNPSPRIVETDSGMLNAIGWANVGLDKFIAEKIPLLQQKNTAIFVNIAGENTDEYAAVVERLAGESSIAGFELNISCPNVKHGGIGFGTNPDLVREVTSAVKNVCGDKILMVKLAPMVTDISAIARAAIESGANALSMINTFTAMVIDIETKTPILANRTGGLSGPAIKPIAVYLVNKVYNEVTKEAGIPILGMGGIRNTSDAIEFMLAGATAVGIGTANFTDPETSINIIKGITKYCDAHSITNIKELTGSIVN
ncbi:MAG: dihydroorotate dehydrogenase [Sedimentisphaerales bacterium]|nr:dihydroorotate dehydrogenase [Sedimentisphaerales bacterium]